MHVVTYVSLERRHEFLSDCLDVVFAVFIFKVHFFYAEKGKEQNNNVYMLKYASIQFIQTVTTCNHRLIICCFIFHRALDSIMFIAPEWLSDPTVCLTFLCHFTTLPSLRGFLGSIVSPEHLTGGAAVADYDGDGLEDIYFTVFHDKSVLYKNNGQYKCLYFFTKMTKI